MMDHHLVKKGSDDHYRLYKKHTDEEEIEA
jgi:hypothetical protein